MQTLLLIKGTTSFGWPIFHHCISYFSIAMIKYHDMASYGRVYLGIQSQRGKTQSSLW